MTGQYVEHLYQDYFINDAQVAVAGAVGGIVDGAQVALRPEKVGAARNGSKLTWNIGLGISSGGPALSVGISIQPGGNPITIAINKSIDGDARAVIKQSSHQAGAPIWETIGVKAAAAVRFMQIIDNDWILAGMAEIEADLQSGDKTIRFKPEAF